MDISICKFDVCENCVSAKGFCGGHYAQQLRGEKLRPLRVFKYDCNFPGCDKIHVAKGYCDGHYTQLKKGKILTAITRAPAGSGCIDSNGYRNITVNGKQIKEHRHIMEQHLSRKLLKHETVHHKNGIRDDNRIENLELWSTSQPAGQRVEDKLAWCKEFLAEYEGKAV